MVAILSDFNLISCAVRLLLAATLGGFVGLERGKHGRAAGLRTHILVCMGSAITVIVGLYTVCELDFSTDPLRIGAQVISGIGFLGAGTILIRGGSQITGLTTAAGLWTTATIGLAVGVGFYAVAIIATAVVLLAFVALSSLERGKRDRQMAERVYMEINSVENMQDLLDQLGDYSDLEVLPAKSGLPGHIGMELMLPHDKDQGRQLYSCLRQSSYIAFIIRRAGAEAMPKFQ